MENKAQKKLFEGYGKTDREHCWLFRDNKCCRCGFEIKDRKMTTPVCRKHK